MSSATYIVYDIRTNMSGNPIKFKIAEFEELEYALIFVEAYYNKYYKENIELSIERVIETISEEEGIGRCEE